MRDKDDLILMTKAMGMRHQDAVKYCEQHGYKITLKNYRRRSAKVTKETLERLHEIGQNLTLHHVERIDQLTTIQNELWSNYHLAEEMSHKIAILRDLRDIQVYLSSYHSSTKTVMESAARQTNQSLSLTNR